MSQKHNEYISPSRQVSIEINGQIYNGSYTVVSDIITVSYKMEKETTQVGGTPPDILARVLLSELVHKENA
ncbi:hypothetical protein [Tumidithrix elongata]|uniref:hypothetical protein n=1 Tax=Tumidithrix elongata TaxID=3088357 RepID=UPI002ED5C5DD